MKNKFFLLSLLLLCSTILSAETINGTCGTNLTWTLNTTDRTLTISGTGAMDNWTEGSTPWNAYLWAIGTVVIDSGTTSIGDYAFMGCNNLASVSISNGVTRIGNHAFHGGNNLTSVTLPNSLIEIGDYAFGWCPLTSLTIPNNVTHLGDHAIYGCTELATVTIGSGVTSIEEHAFSSCGSITSITIPASVTSIMAPIFIDCNALSSIVVESGNPKYDSRNNCNAIIETATNTLVQGCNNTTIPTTVTKIGRRAFQECRNLTSIVLPNSVTSIGEHAFYDCSGMTEPLYNAHVFALLPSSYIGAYSIPQGIEFIVGGAFSHCSGLTSVTIPGSVTSIEESTFISCENLTSVTIEEGVTSIGSWSFAGCPNLTSIEIPNSVTEIGGAAFLHCGLTTITIPNSVITIGGSVFGGCQNLINIYVASDNPQYDSRNNCNAIIETATNTLLYGCKNTVIPNSVTSINGEAFVGRYVLTSIDIPNSITSIGYSAFSDCSYLTSVNLGDGVTDIDELAFNGCTSLTSVEFSNPTPPTFGGTNAFAGTTCTFLVPCGSKDAYMAALNRNVIDNYWIEESRIIEVGIACGNCGAQGDNLTWVLYGDSVLVISGSGAMADWEEGGSPWYSYRFAIKSVVINSGVTSIGNYAFRDLNDMTSVTVPNGITRIGIYAFGFCYKLPFIDLPNSVTHINAAAFEGCESLNSIAIPTSVTSIDGNPFTYCKSLDSIVVEAGNTHYDSRNNCNAIIETLTNKLINGCKNTVIPEDISCLAEHAFEGCTSLTSIVIPKSVTSLEFEAFRGCTALTSITIPNSVTSIKSNVFVGCGLTSITIPKSVAFIGSDAFHGCSNMESVTFVSAEPPTIQCTSSFINTNCNFYVPCGRGEAYIEALNRDVCPYYEYYSIDASRIIETSMFPYEYTVSSADANKGAVAITQEPSCSDPIWSVRADANDGYIFKRWSDGNTQNPRIVELTQDTSIVAEFIDAGNIIAFGTCGAQGDNLRWELSCDGSLSIYGTGNMYNWYTESCPWSPQRMQISSVVIQEGVTSIGVSAFSGCRNLISITIPDGVTSIGEYAFVDCNNLNSIIIPESVTSLGGDVFQNCSSLTSITIPNSVTGSLGFYMFQGCSSLRTVVIGDNITSIGHQAFCDCINLTDVTIGNSVESIESLAFSSCKKLTSINIPSSVTRIEYAAFNACYSLERVYINDIAAWCAITFVDNPLSTARHLYLNGSEISNLIIPDGVTSIGEKAFYNCISIKSVIIPNSVTSIGVGAFSHCDGIQSVNVTATNVPTLSTSSELSQFNGYTTFIVPAASLTAYKTADNWSTYANHILPDNIQTEYNITVSAYNDKSALQVEIGEDNLINVTKLKVSGTINSYDFMVFRNKMLNLHELDLSDVSIVENSYNYYGEYHSEDNVIGPMTFYDLKRLTSVILPESITKIGANAFWMTSLSSLVIPSSVQMIEGGAFYNVPIKTLILQEGLKQIGSGAFESCSITSLSTPSSLEIIGNSAFAYCNELQEVNVLSGVERIEEYAFRGCLKLTVFNVGEGLKSIGYEAFGNCSALPEMHLPDGLETIGQHSFNGCSALRELTIPSSVTSIGDGAFLSTNMQSVYVKVVDPITISQVAFSTETFQNATLYIPRNEEWSTTYWKYYYDTQWSQFVHLGEWDPTFSEFNINNDYDLDAGTIQGDSIDDGHGHRVPRHPRGHFRPGCGFIVDHTGHQHLRDGHLFYDGSRWASLIGDLRQWTDGGSHEPEANLIIDTLFCDINVEANHWYFFSFPFDVNRSQISAPGNFIFRAYDGGRRAQMNTSSGNWMDIPAGSTHLTAGTGYIFQCNQSGTLSIPMFNPDFSAEEPHTLEQHSSANAQNANWNFVGNPYTSYYQLEDINYDAPITVWNGNGYEAVRPGDDDYTFTPFQGYFVQKPNAQTSQVGHDRSKRETHGQSQAHAAHAAERRAMQQVNPNRLLVNLTITDGTNTDKTRIVYNDAHTMDYELDCDAAKFVSSEPIPQIYTTNAGVNYAINERPKGSYEAALTVKCPADGSYTITATRMDVPLFLEDRLTGAMHDLTLGGYSFFAEQGYATGRFYVRLNGNATGIADFLAQTGVSVFASDGKLNITGITDKEVNIFSASGQQVAQMTVDGLISVPTGTYLVQVGDSAMKVIVK